VEFLNRTRGDHYTLYTLEFGNLAYYADGRFMGDWFGPARYSLITDTSFRSPQLYQQLRKLGANYFLVAENHRDRDEVAESVLAPDFLNGRFRLVYAGLSSLLFELEDQPVEVAVPAELLNNRGFEQLSAGAPSGWSAAGTPLVDASEIQAYESRTAIRADRNDYLTQRVPVQSGAIYLLRNVTRAAKPGQFARLQINWMNRKGDSLVAVDIQVIPVDSAWHRHTLAAMAPPDASWADVYASVHEDSEVWFDDFSFAALHYR
jgi:hypothetical protein